ncbi:MAG: PHP domain-containing protein [Bacteroidetes bacterium]|nr:PHP domain-containing protein [Bacteroidota bacterium]MCL5026099.1 PHP domain-containing protein [Chloroflexota bacterium]
MTSKHILADLHCHTHCSPDCDMTPQRLVAAALRRGLECIAVTDHNTMANVREVQALAPFKVIPGEEIKTPYGEIIGLFLRDEIPAGLSPQETCDRIREQGGLVVVPHPFDLVRSSHLGKPFLESILPSVDALEVKNARVVFWWHNARAKACAQRHGLPMTAGSDCHMPIEVGQVRVEMPPFHGVEDFLDCLRQGRILGRASSPFVHLYTGWVKQAKRRR